MAARSFLMLMAILCGSCDGANSKAAAAPPSAQPNVAKASSPAALGKLAPDFTLTDTDGKTHKLSSLRGKVVVLEWFNPECPFVKHAHGKGPLVDMAKRESKPNLVWLAINSGAAGKQGHGLERNQAGKRDFAIEHPILLDESGTVGRAYGAIKTPHMFVIDDKGKLVYRGGLDNAPMGVVDDARPRPPLTQAGSLVPYVHNALEDLAAKRPVALADTPAYGCSVKYAD